jgi:hypothetical protein
MIIRLEEFGSSGSAGSVFLTTLPPVLRKEGSFLQNRGWQEIGLRVDLGAGIDYTAMTTSAAQFLGRL